MTIARTLDELAPSLGGVLVPTMGALHVGHLDLVRHAATIAHDRGGLPVVVSIFVNPTQFDEQHDYDRYPRQVEHDAQRCFDAGATCVFAPQVETMYPPDGSVGVPPIPAVGDGPGLEDTYRPGHFAGVCQVCNRLFELCEPVASVFGEKDWQQLRVVTAMVEAAGMGIDIVGYPTVRETDGLAMSSRNVHLDDEERARAAALSKALRAAGAVDEPTAAEATGRTILEAASIETEYFAVREARDLLRQPEPGEAGRVLVAGRLGLTRLIDNAPWPAMPG